MCLEEKRREGDTQGQKSCEDRGRDWSIQSKELQGLLAAPGRHGESPKVPPEAQPCRDFDFRLLPSRAVKTQISIVLRHLVCGNFCGNSYSHRKCIHRAPAWLGLPFPVPSPLLFRRGESQPTVNTPLDVYMLQKCFVFFQAFSQFDKDY